MQFHLNQLFKINVCLMPVLYDKAAEKMKLIASENYLWVAIDETTDCQQRYVANFVFGVLGVETEIGKSYLFSMAVLQCVNSNTIGTFFDETVNKLSEFKF